MPRISPLLQPVISFALRQTVGDVGVAVQSAVVSWFRDNTQLVPKALGRAADRSWQAVGVSLGGDGLLDKLGELFRGGDQKAYREQVREFLRTAPLPPDMQNDEFRRKCLGEWKRAREQSFGDGCECDAVAAEADNWQRFTEPHGLVASATQAVARVADDLAADFPNLSRLLRQPTPAGPPLLAAAFAYFFRREVETTPELARGLTLDTLHHLAGDQAARFDGLDAALAQLGDRTETVLVELIEVHTAVLDVREVVGEVKNVQISIHTDVQRIENKVQSMLDRLELKAEVKPRDSFSIRTDAERRAVKQLLEEFRKLPEDAQARFPALLNGLGKLQVGIGDFDGAAGSFRQSATVAVDPLGQAEAHFNAYRASLERKDFDSALTAARRAAELAAKRYAPFPLKRFQPKAILGAGGFGTVFLCEDRNFKNRPVAIKALHADDLDRGAEEIFAEAHVLTELHHPAVIRILDAAFADADDDTRPYLVMEYFPGQTLAAAAVGLGGFPVDAFLPVAAQIAAGMYAAHARGILHRDLKPENVLVRQENGAWRVKIIDFGLALRRSAVETRSMSRDQSMQGSSVAGTLRYAPPEQLAQLEGVKPGPYSDVFAFGKLCCFCLFRTTEPKRRHWDAVPGWFAELIERCTEEGLAERFPDFDPILDALPVSAVALVPELKPRAEARIASEKKKREAEEAERKHKQEEEDERRRQEAARIEQERLEAERKNREEEEAERKRVAEAAERERIREEAERKRREEEEEAERKRQEAARIEQQRQEEERRRLEAEQKKREEEEAERKRLAEAAERERIREEAERKRREAEEVERKRQEAARIERQRQEEERRRLEAERKKREEQETEQKRLAEAERKRQEEEVERKRQEAARIVQQRQEEERRLEAERKKPAGTGSVLKRLMEAQLTETARLKAELDQLIQSSWEAEGRTYKYEALNTSGAEVTGSVQASSEEEAQKKIRDMGYFVTKLTATPSGGKRPDPAVSRRAEAVRKRKEEEAEPNRPAEAEEEPGFSVHRRAERLYEYQALDTHGESVEDSIQAATEEEARQKIRDRGYFVIKLAATRTAIRVVRPNESAINAFSCPACRVGLLLANPKDFGRMFTCPACRKSIQAVHPSVQRRREAEEAARRNREDEERKRQVATPGIRVVGPDETVRNAFDCPACSATLELANPKDFGRMFTCPACHKPIQACRPSVSNPPPPPPDPSFETQCPYCSQQVVVPSRLAGARVGCPRCKGQFSATVKGTTKLSVSSDPDEVDLGGEPSDLDSGTGVGLSAPPAPPGPDEGDLDDFELVEDSDLDPGDSVVHQPPPPPAASPSLAACPHCQKTVRIPAAMAGQPVKCPHPNCGRTFAAPGPDAPAPKQQPRPRDPSRSLKQLCPCCESVVKVANADMIGKKVACPKCAYRFTVVDPDR